MRLSQKDLRIIKCLNKGMKPEEIARKIGYGGNLEDGIARVNETKGKIKV